MSKHHKHHKAKAKQGPGNGERMHAPRSGQGGATQMPAGVSAGVSVPPVLDGQAHAWQFEPLDTWFSANLAP